MRKESVLRKTVRKQMQLIKRHKMRPDTFLSRTLWQYRLSSFQGDTKLEIFVVKNQDAKNKILYFVRHHYIVFQKNVNNKKMFSINK